MGKFTITGFADEISDDIYKQIQCLKELNINFLELRSVDGINVSDFSDDMIVKVKKILDDNNIKVSAIGSPVGKYEIDEDFSLQIQKFNRIVEIAKKMDTRYIRIFSFFVAKESLDTYKDEVIKRLSEFVKIAEKENMILLHENEKGIFGEDAIHCKYIFDNIKSSNFFAIFDPANFVLSGVDTLEAFQLLKEHIIYLHIKDARLDGEIVPSGDGSGNIAKILSELNENGYEGFLSLEPHLGDFMGFAALGKEERHWKKFGGPEEFKCAYEKLMEIINNI